MKSFVVLAFLALSPTLAFSQEASWNMGVEKRLDTLEKRVTSLESRLGSWNFGASTEGHSVQRGSESCPCPNGGKCICPAGDCDCPNCPIHHADTVWKGDKPTNRGRELLYFGTDWCANCPAAAERLGDLTKEIIYVDCTEDDTLAGLHMVDSYPSMVLIEDGIKVGSCFTSGTSVGSYLASKWLKAPLSSLRASRSESYSSPRESYRVVSRGSSAPRITSRTVYRDSNYSPASSGGRPLNLSRIPGPSWNNPGDLRSHLINEHGYSPSQINGLSYSQLNILKDNDHNSWGHGGHPYAGRSRSLSYFSPPSSYRPVTYFSSGPSYGGCPGGNCPR